jgi:GNAT superfamily N-acetyltransferase
VADSLTQPVSEVDLALGFSCGVAALDQFFARHALENDRRGLGRTFVLHQTTDGKPGILGFYTLSMATVEGRLLPRRLRGGLPKYPLPVALVGRLAVHQAHQRRGVGEFLLTDAFKRILTATETIGCFGVVTDAKDEAAETFYVRYDFAAVEKGKSYPRRLFVPLETVRASREATMPSAIRTP